MIWGLFDKKKKQAESAQPEEQARGLFDGLRKSSSKLAESFTSVFTKEKLDPADIAELEDALVTSDMGASAAARIASALADQRFSKENGVEEARVALAAEIARILKPREATLDLTNGPKPRIVLVIGVNGSGKTTTIGKLANNLTNAGAKVVIGAADTFRAAAIEQLKVWADRAEASFVTSTQGADAAGVAFETVKRAKEENADVALIDTAGRLQNKSELMAELAKIVRVIRKIDEDAPHETLLVLDATVGQNALSQVESFRSVTDITGLVMTKLDGTAKGGVLVALAQRHAIPIHFIGVGEKAKDLQPFDAASFSRALVGLE
ncbi:MAG: signal recognition particle-docking protein FtsY [Hyphomonadaceae bacterium JAD_PAG50586_4]|nr:MAG: signal recognition particle-docking protein FtsY [Hyphomonadaceae bacterium JAD_PAG50586_4]